jgi:hypothetical protein
VDCWRSESWPTQDDSGFLGCTILGRVGYIREFKNNVNFNGSGQECPLYTI